MHPLFIFAEIRILYQQETAAGNPYNIRHHGSNRKLVYYTAEIAAGKFGIIYEMQQNGRIRIIYRRHQKHGNRTEGKAYLCILTKKAGRENKILCILRIDFYGKLW